MHPHPHPHLQGCPAMNETSRFRAPSDRRTTPARLLACAALALGAWACAPALAQSQAAPAAPPPAAGPVPVERFFQHPVLTAAKLSPSGTRMAITTSRGADRVGLFVVELAPSVKGTRVAQFNNLDVADFDWTSDDRLVFSLVDLKSGSGDDRYFAPGLVSVKADGSEMVTLVRRDGETDNAGGRVRGSAPTGYLQLLHVPRQQPGVPPDEVVAGRVEFKNAGLHAVTPVWLDVRSGRVRALDVGNAPPQAKRWWFDSKGQPRVAITSSEGREAIHWRGPQDSGWKQIAEADVLKPRMAVLGVDDSGALFVTEPRGPQAQAVLARFDFARGAADPAPLVSTPGFDFEGSLITDRSGARALGVRLRTDAEDTVWLDEGMKKVQATVDQRLPGRVNRINCRRCGEADMVALVRSYSDRDPGEYWLYQAAGQRFQPVMRVMDGIDARQMAEVQFHRIRARDGRDLPVWLTVPRGVKPGQPAPAVVMVHGGPWVRGGAWAWNPMDQFLASRGWIVISPEFRGSTGFGAEHFRAGWKQWGQAMQDDVADALLWAREKGLAGPAACIAGASYGGYSTLMGLVRHPELYRCGVAWVAVTDLELLVKGSRWVDDDTGGDFRNFTMPELVGDPVKDAEMIKANSPVLQASRIRAPLLLGFGEADIRVPLAHGTRMREALTAAGRPPEWVVYPEEGHSWRKVSTQVDFFQKVEAFLSKHLGGGSAAAAPR